MKAAVITLLTAGLMFGAAAPVGAKTQVSKADVLLFEDPTEVVGHSTLKRKANSIKINVHAEDMPEGAHTLWWVVFNDPGACSDGVCGEDDIFTNGAPDIEKITAAKIDIGNADGLVSNGTANFTATLNSGDTDGFFFGRGLMADNGNSAEVHVVVRYHGPVSDNPEVAATQTTTVWGGCSATTDGPSDEMDPDGLHEFDCFDPAFSVHLP